MSAETSGNAVLPFYILCDESGSMDANGGIDAINSGLPELHAAMTEGWSESGTPDPALALKAALLAARSGIDGIDMTRIVQGRAKARCQAPMPRAQSTCIRMRGHPGPHRSR